MLCFLGILNTFILHFSEKAENMKMLILFHLTLNFIMKRVIEIDDR